MKFLDTHFANEYNIDAAGLAEIVKTRASAYEDAQIRTAYATNLDDSIDALLVDEDFVVYAKEHGAGEAMERIMDSVSEEFNRQIAATEAANKAELDKFLAEKADARQSLYFAAVAFGVFLLIVFLSIIIRIERNLRPQGIA